MKKLKYSLVTLAALGALSFANAETAGAEKVDKTIPPSTKNSLLDALKGTTIGGYAYGQYTSMFGKDASGGAFRVRTAINVDTGAYEGFSVGTRIFASQGKGSGDGGTLLGNSKSPSSDPAYNAPIPLGLQVLYGRMAFQSTATVIEAGKINIATPFSDSNFDAGTGVSFKNQDISGITFNLQAYGVWGLDNGNSISSAGNSSDSTMIIAGVSGDPKEFGVGFNAWVAHIFDTVNFLAYGDVQYSISGLTLSGKVAATQVNTDNTLFRPSNPKLAAELRGLYNVQVAYALGDTTIAGGYTGSFGDGYGVLLNNSAFNMGGNIWWDVASNGYGMLGAGGVKNSNGNASTIMVAYASVKYKGIKSLSMGLDYAFVSGDNNYALMAKGKQNNAGAANKNVTLHEVSATLGYAFSEKLALSAIVGSTFGDLAMGRARMRLTYSF